MTLKAGISYIGVRELGDVKRDLDIIKSGGFDYVVHTLSETDMAYYRKNIEIITEETKQRGLEVKLDPWGVAGIFGGETLSRFVADNLEARQVISDGRSVAMACLNNPATFDFIKKWLDMAASYSVDEVFWDEPHFYEPFWLGHDDKGLWGCRCDYCKEGFRAKYNKEIPVDEAEEVKQFKIDSVVDFLDKASKYAASLGLNNSTCLLPSVPSLETDIWAKAAGLLELDNIGVDPYWVEIKKQKPDFDCKGYIKKFSDKVLELAEKNSIKAHVWIQNFKISNGNEQEVREAFNVIYNAGVRDIAAWSFMGTRVMADMACDSPGRVWQILTECIKSKKEA